MKLKLIGLTVALVGQMASADIAVSQVRCKVTHLEPSNARFFMMLETPPVVGDTTTLDLSAEKISAISFDSGNALGSPAFSRNPAVKQKTSSENLTFYQTTFLSGLGRGTYDARLTAHLALNKTINVFVDVTLLPKVGRAALNSLVMECNP